MNYKFTLLLLFYSLFGQAQVSGCTDVNAINYNPQAVQNDGSCVYKKETVRLPESFPLSEKLTETSGLIYWNKRLWTHNDDTDTNLYALDTINGSISETYLLPNITNTDWEEIAQDENFIYVGDFGNNASGNRTDLHIIRIEKNSLLDHHPQIDYIKFKYGNQDNFSLQSPNKTNFDCEAFLVTQDSIYLFTKEWKDKRTTLYVLPKIPGEYVAQKKGVYNIKGLVTGAAYLETKKVLALCGYTRYGKPFVSLLYDFQGNDFFSGNKRQLKLKPHFYQIEGIATQDGLHYYITSEHLKFALADNPQKMHVLDLSKFLETYLKAK